MKGGSGTRGLAGDGQVESSIDDPLNLNENAPPTEAVHGTPQQDGHVVEAEMPHMDELGRHNRDEAPSTTTLHEAQCMDQREIDAGSSTEVGQLGTYGHIQGQRDACWR
ncbi:hypothetical protein K435DRAFT_857799 [Dendrothele bispora CBS 962.96]|uniref:Uncharacterized protein n=1 Tax=Dendrothele bispora (strain CBS 962.96) TaxID=1314807 RepID=A0A4V4HG37_DENBC|nr:hypothetical protein K435DRAFT_857799 [Dendrothele bispora CBS 962.96]